MSAPAPLGYAANGDSTERQEDPIPNEIIRDPSYACAEERQGDEQSKVARLGVHSCPDLKGAATKLPLPCARVDGLEPVMKYPAVGRQAIFLGTTEPRAARPGFACRGAISVGQGRLAVSTVGKKTLTLTRADAAQRIST